MGCGLCWHLRSFSALEFWCLLGRGCPRDQPPPPQSLTSSSGGQHGPRVTTPRRRDSQGAWLTWFPQDLTCASFHYSEHPGGRPPGSPQPGCGPGGPRPCNHHEALRSRPSVPQRTQGWPRAFLSTRDNDRRGRRLPRHDRDTRHSFLTGPWTRKGKARTGLTEPVGRASGPRVSPGPRDLRFC